MTVTERIEASGQKRLLSLDGGGIRGVISLEVLVEMERKIRADLGKPDDFVLADYFDFIGGTSTGAIIAAGLAMRKSATHMRTIYHESGEDMFQKANLWRRYIRNKYEHRKIEMMLKKEFGADTTLGSDRLRSLLMVVLKNQTTDSPWPVTNNPKAKYNQRDRDNCNLDIPLWQLVRASTAAPVFFRPEAITVGRSVFQFVDGGVTQYNNPALAMFLMATVEPYKIGWQTGIDKMLLVSVGTGAAPENDQDLRAKEMNIIYNAKNVPTGLMYGALVEQDKLCRVLGDCVAGEPIDSEIEDLIGAAGPTPKLFTYARLNAELSKEGLDAIEVIGVSPDDVKSLDSVDAIPEMQEVGKGVARKHLGEVRFADFSDGVL